MTALQIVGAEVYSDQRPTVVLEGNAAVVGIDLLGGSIADFRFRGSDLNPLSWGRDRAGDGPAAMGHFLCLDRWASASRAEAGNGMPGHGEASAVAWQVLRGPQRRDGFIEVEMAATLPLANFEVRRLIRLAEEAAFLTVREEIENKGKLGRIYNAVQHPTIGPPFLDETTVVDANARQGYMVYSPMPHPEVSAVLWPEARKLDSWERVDMRYLAGDDDPTNAGYRFDAEHGWLTASTAGKGLLIGYIWKTADYPWLNIWRSSRGGKPIARGLEFGTTSLPLPPAALVAKGRIFELPLFEYLDASQTVTKDYTAFLFEIPPEYAGTEQVFHVDRRLVVRPRGTRGDRGLAVDAFAAPVSSTEADLTMDVDHLFLH